VVQPREMLPHLEARVKAPALALCARREMDYNLTSPDTIS
jgi:hypothetical protein